MNDQAFLENTTSELLALSDACSLRLSNCYSERGMIASPIPLPILGIDTEAAGIATLWVQVPKSLASEYRPGQYFMCWNPYDSAGGMNRSHFSSEKPYSVGNMVLGTDGRVFLGFTVKDLGIQSGELTKLSIGDWLAIRGPFGTSFPDSSDGDRMILVSGGIGSTPIHMAALSCRNALGDRVRIDAIMGFRNSEESHYVSRMEAVCDSVQITTDDGTLGSHGFPTIHLPNLIESPHRGRPKLFTCGPEPMMKAVLMMAIDAGIESYAAMERYLPCSVAVCGLCMVGDRLTCIDGPVMEGDWLLGQDDFGKPHIAHSHT